MARLAGFEPTTPWFVAKYSIQLSYSRAKPRILTSLFLAGSQRGLHKVGHGSGLDLVHDVGPVGFNGLDADVQVVRNLFVQSAGYDTVQDLFLSRCQTGQQLLGPLGQDAFAAIVAHLLEWADRWPGE